MVGEQGEGGRGRHRQRYLQHDRLVFEHIHETDASKTKSIVNFVPEN